MLPTRRLHLDVKINSLADEARRIKCVERRLKRAARRARSRGRTKVSDHQLDGLENVHRHRIGVVRREARHSQLARAFLKGQDYHVVEQKVREGNAPNLQHLAKIVDQFNPEGVASTRKVRELRTLRDVLTTWLKGEESPHKVKILDRVSA
jgi:hypothetical protein